MTDNYDGPLMAQKIIRLQAEVERLRGLLREAREIITTDNGDAGCPDGECCECDMTRLAIRIDAALAPQTERQT